MKKYEYTENINTSLSSVWITASAGSGKTSVLIERIIQLIIEGISPSQILCLTFTKAASIEMRERVTQRLFQWSNLNDNELKVILKKYKKTKNIDLINFRSLSLRLLEDHSSINIQTIHSFCENILKKFPIEAGVLPNFSVLDANEADSYIIEARNLAFKKYSSNIDFENALKNLVVTNDEKNFNDLFAELSSKKIRLSKIWSDPNELKNVIKYIYSFFDLDASHTPSSLISNACDLSKDKINFLKDIAKKISEGTSSDILKSEIINKWVNSKNRVKNWENYKSIFLTKKNSISKNIFSKKILNKYPNLIDQITIEAKRIFEVEEKISFIDILSKIVSSLIVFKYIMIEYQKVKSSSNLLDYDDLIYFTLNLFNKTDIAPWVIYKFDQKIKHFLIDESQDTSKEQWDLLYRLITEIFSTNSENINDKTIFIVGDEKQSIFSFQGADPEVLDSVKNRFTKYFKKFNIDLVESSLSQSYRSVGIILNFVDMIFAEENDIHITSTKKNGRNIKHLELMILV